MKKTISIILAATLILSLLLTAVSCGSEAPTASTEAPDATEATSPTEAPETSETLSPTEAPTETETPPETETPEPAAGSPLLWRVTDEEGHELYLFGTIHVGDERSDPVLERVAPILESCDALAVEFDAVAYTQKTDLMMNDMVQYVLTDGSVVSDYMPEDVYQASYELLEQAGLFPGLFKQYNLAWWTQMVQSAMVQVYTDLSSDKALDSILIYHAYDKDIPILEVESSSFQMTMLNSFDNELYLLQIEDALNSTETYSDEVNELYTLWLSGDKDAFWSYIANENEEDASLYTEEQLALIEDYNRRLVDERNLGMCDKAIEYLNSGETVFFAVGAAHMANEAGLVQLLIDAGYTVEQIAY